MSPSRVSVLMPAYNAELYIAESIESILHQTFTDFECIIIDDCSQDSTREIIQRYADIDHRIIAMQNKTNLNIAWNRNKLLDSALWEYIIRQDADDISVVDRLEKQVDFMDQHPDVGICGGYLEVFNEKWIVAVRKYPTHDAQLKKLIFRVSPIAQPAAILRKKAIDEIQWFDLAYPPAEDLDLTFRIGQNRAFANIPQIVIRYRDSQTNATSRKLYRMEVATLSIRFKYDGFGNYKMTWRDRFYQFAHLWSTFVMSSSFKIRVYNVIRRFI